ncbi:topoisomerase II-associated protein [Salix suchowensis]|nr:topoisomerase II-associated protein [Salix suchowensis]
MTTSRSFNATVSGSYLERYFPVSVLPGRTGVVMALAAWARIHQAGLSTSPRPLQHSTATMPKQSNRPSKFSPFDNGPKNLWLYTNLLVTEVMEFELCKKSKPRCVLLPNASNCSNRRSNSSSASAIDRTGTTSHPAAGAGAELLVRQRLQLQQEQQQQLQLQQLQRLQQQQYLQERAHQHNQQEQQQQQRLLELQERLRIEDLDRQLRATQISQLSQGPTAHRRTPSGPTIAEYQTAILQQQLQQQQQNTAVSTPSRRLGNVPLGQGLNYLPQSIQLQQRLLSELAQAEFLRDMHGGAPVDQEALRTEALRKIVEAEQMEEKRRRKAMKIARMVCFVLRIVRAPSKHIFTNPLLVHVVQIQRSDDTIRQGLHHSYPGLTAVTQIPMLRTLRSSIRRHPSVQDGIATPRRAGAEVRFWRRCGIRTRATEGQQSTAKRHAANGAASRADCEQCT